MPRIILRPVRSEFQDEVEIVAIGVWAGHDTGRHRHGICSAINNPRLKET